jgi:hypothetical protein
MIKIKSYLKALTPSVRKPAVIVSQNLVNLSLFAIISNIIFFSLYLLGKGDCFLYVGTFLVVLVALIVVFHFCNFSLSVSASSIKSIFKSSRNPFNKS